MGESRRDCKNKQECAGRVKSLYRQPEKKKPFISEESVLLVRDKGIEGDVHGDGGIRQVLIFTEAQKNWMEAQDVKGFCFLKLKENIELTGEQHLEAGDILVIGEAELIITEEKKECYPELCKFAKQGKVCMLSGAHMFAQVGKGGKISRGMICTLKKGQ